MSSNIHDEDPFDAAEAAAALPLSADDVPPWVKEGTASDDDDIGGEDISAAKPMEPRSEWIEPAKGVLFTIEKVVIETFTPKDEEVWKHKKMNVYLKIADGIKYPGNPKPVYKGKMLFQRMFVAVNRQAEKDGVYDFSVNAQGKPTDYWSPSGGAFGEYSAFLKAMGLPTSPAPRNDKAFRDALVGRQIVYDIEKVQKEEWDSKTKTRSKIKGEYENVLSNATPARSAAAAVTSAPAAAAAASDDEQPWNQ